MVLKPRPKAERRQGDGDRLVMCLPVDLDSELVFTS